ncbi:MAG: thioredoxin-like domain-containing protein [Bacteroidota bacterium]
MKKISFFTLLLLIGIVLSSFAKDGYKIQVKATDKKDSIIYLAHYYGKPLPTIFKADSAKFDKNGVATFSSKEYVLGGIYLILFSNKETHFEFLLNNGDDMSITVTTKSLPEGVKFKNSPENDRFCQYVTFQKEFGTRVQALQTEYKNDKTKEDSIATRKKINDASKELVNYRRDYVKKNPNTLLTNIFNALEIPEVPEGKHLLPDGKIDSSFAYRYYKQHYWDGFDFTDDRLIHTPIYDAKLDEYFNKLVMQINDSVSKEADRLLARTRGQKELFKYTLYWITRHVETSKIMGMDEVFVYLVENYYMKGDAYWLDNDALNKYYDRASKIAPNLIGNLAPEIKMIDKNKVERPLSSVKAKYTLVVFWDPTCGHCTKEIPIIDSIYKAVLKDKGVKVYSVRTEGEESKWEEFINKNDLNDWINVYDPEHQSDYRAKYDVYSTPIIYLLDENRIIRGKKLDHSNILPLVEMLEKKKNAKKS